MGQLDQRSSFELLWAITRGDSRVVVALLDGPVETNHACLSGARLELVAVFSSDTAESPESQQHGTHVTSQIFATGDCGLVGIAPGCSGLLIPVFRSSADGGLIAASQVELARAIRLAVDRGANIINISGGELSPTPEANQFLTDALAYCEQEGVLVVAAAGNDGCDCLHVPASMGTVVAVGALDSETGEPTDFSNWGRAYRNNAILAPGKDIPGAQAGGGLATRSGTSFAAPIVSGVAALLMSIQLIRGMAVDARAVRAALLKGATPCDAAVAGDCRPYLVGTLDVNASLGLLTGGEGPVEPSQAVSEPGDDGQEAAPAICALPRDGVAAASTIPAVERRVPSPDAPELVEAADSVESFEAVESSVADAETIGAQLVQPSDSSHPKRRLAAEQIQLFSGAAATGAALLANRHNNVGEGNTMSNEQLDNNGAPQSGDAAEPATPSGVEASGAVVQEASAGATPNSGVEPSGVEASGAVVQEASAGATPNGGVEPSGGVDCDCGPAGPAQLVFALGELGYDLVTEARKDSLWQAMDGNPYDWNNLHEHLTEHAWDAADVTWTLRIDATPIYAIQPAGPFAAGTYELLANILIGQIDKDANYERVSIPGWIVGTTALSNGITVPVIVPSRRGIFAWDTTSLAAAVKKADGDVAGLPNFLERVYYELRNLGQSPQERAINYAATNAFQVSQVFHDSFGVGHELDLIEVEKSPICRQDSDCWDVKLTFFDPQNDRAARHVHRFTIDVSDVVPCTVGRIRSWAVR